MCRRVGQSLSIKKDRMNTASLSFADLITLDQITLCRDTWSIIWCFPPCDGKVCLFFLSAVQAQQQRGVYHRQIKLLQLRNVIVQVSTWNLRCSLCQVSGKQRLLTNWLNRDQGTCHIKNLKQAPFGGSQGHSFRVEERMRVPIFSFQSYRACRD